MVGRGRAVWLDIVLALVLGYTFVFDVIRGLSLVFATYSRCSRCDSRPPTSPLVAH